VQVHDVGLDVFGWSRLTLLSHATHLIVDVSLLEGWICQSF